MIKNILFVLLLITLIVLLVPGMRERAQPRIDDSREWLGQQLEGPLSPILTPYRTLKTESRMGEAVRILIRDRNRGRRPPTPAGFEEFLVQRDIEPVDAWGAPMLLDQEPDSLAIISAGADLEYRTDDDIVAKIRYAAPRNSFIRR